jgi:hypothetical protein
MTRVAEAQVLETTVSAPAQQEFYSALQNAAEQALAGIYNETIYPIQYPAQGDFLWNFQNGNQIFNQGTFDYISANVAPGGLAGTAQLSPSGGFPNAYVQLLSKLAYALSTTDLAAVNTALRNASAQATTIVNDYQTTFGQITPAQMTVAQNAVGSFAVQTFQDYVIAYVLGYLWSGQQTAGKPPLTYTQMANARNLRTLLPAMPSSGNTVVADVSNYLSMLQPVNAIQSNQQLGSWIIAQLNLNTSQPSTANGGMSTVNPGNGQILPPQVAYNLGSASIASITNDLNNTARELDISMTTAAASGNQLSVSVQGQAQVTVGSFLRFTTSVGASYDMSQAAGTSSSASVKMTYAGYSLVPVNALAWQQATNQGWYYGDPIAQAVTNGTKDVTGFKFVAPTGYNLLDISRGGNFGQLTALLISNYPTITITYTNASYSEFSKHWSESVSGNLSLFGFISLGSFSQGAYGSSYQSGADNSTFTVSFSASPQVIGLPTMMQQAYVIGGGVNNPGVTPGSGVAVLEKLVAASLLG